MGAWPINTEALSLRKQRTIAMIGDPNHLFHMNAFLLGKLFEREEAQLTRREHAMVAKNTQLGGSTDGFRHMGAIYTQLTGTARRRGSYGRLDPSLAPEIDVLISERKVLAEDKDRIRQALTLILRDCQSLQDMRDALPNGVKNFFPELAHMERTRPEAFTLADNPRSYTQYMKLREKIEFYVATQLLY